MYITLSRRQVLSSGIHTHNIQIHSPCSFSYIPEHYFTNLNIGVFFISIWDLFCKKKKTHELALDRTLKS
jgi:hypothetical protein